MHVHPQTLYDIRDTDRRAWLEEAARDRLAAAARPATDPGPSPAVAARRRLGAVLVGIGTRLQGDRPAADPAVPARPVVAHGRGL